MYADRFSRVASAKRLTSALAVLIPPALRITHPLELNNESRHTPIRWTMCARRYSETILMLCERKMALRKSCIGVRVLRRPWLPSSSRTGACYDQWQRYHRRALHASARRDVIKPFLLADIGEGQTMIAHLLSVSFGSFFVRSSRYWLMTNRT